jgi:hypothetical protein
MSLYDQYYADAEPTSKRPNSESEFSKGLRGAGAGMGAQLSALGQGATRAFGGSVSPEATQALQQQLLEAQQAEQAAANPTWASVHDLRGGANWLGYKAGQLTPALVGGMGAGLLGGLTKVKGGAIAAPTALFAPLEAGDISLRQQQDPEAQLRSPQENFGRAALGGLASSAALNIVPGTMAGRMLGAGAEQAAGRTIGQSFMHNMGAGVLGQGVAGAGGEGIRQLATSGQVTDPNAIKEAGVDNAVLGGAFGMAGMAGDMVHGMPRKALKGVGDAFSVAKEDVAQSRPGKAATGVWDNLGEIAQGLYDGVSESKLGKGAAETYKATKQDISDLLSDTNVPPDVKEQVAAGAKGVGDKAYDAYVAAAKSIRETFEPIKKDLAEKGAAQTALDYLGVAKGKADKKLDDLKNNGFFGDPEAMRKANPEQAKSMADASEAEANRRANDLFREMEGSGHATDEVQAASRDLNVPENRATIAKAAEDKGFLDTLMGKVSSFTKGMNEAMGGDKGGAKKSEDFSAAHDIIAKELLPAITDERLKSALVSSRPMQTELVSGIRKWMSLAGREANIQKGKDGRYENLGKFRFENKKEAMFDNLVSILGPDTGPALTRVYNAIRGKDPEEVNNVFGHINGAVDTHDQYDTVQKGLVAMLPRGSEHYSVVNDPQTAKHLMNWVRGNDKQQSEESTLYNKEMHRQMQAIFGKKADKAYALLENAAMVERDRPSNITGTDQKVGKSVGETDESAVAAQAAKEGLQRDNAELEHDFQEGYHKNEDGSIRDLFVGEGDKAGRQSVATVHASGDSEGMQGIGGMMDHPDVQKGKFKSAKSYTQHVMGQMEKNRPNHKWEFVSMREHADRLAQGGMKDRDVIADIDKNFPDLAEVPEHEWDTHGYVRGVNKETGQGELYIGKGDKVGTVKRGTGKLNGLFRSPAHEQSTGMADAQSSTESRIRELRNQYPGYNVSFVTAKDYMKSSGKSWGTVQEQFPHMVGMDEKHAGNVGYIKLQGKDRDAEGIAPYELRRVQLDAKNHGRSPARFNVGDRAYDAVRLTSEFSKKMGYDHTSGNDATDMQRIKEAFTNGYAAVLQHESKGNGFNNENGETLSHDQVVKAPKGGTDRMLGNIDPDTVVAYRKGRKITVGDLRGDLGSRFPEPKNLSPEMQKQLAHVDELTRDQLVSAHKKAWVGEDVARDKLHKAGIEALEGKFLKGKDYNLALAKWKQEHLSDPDFRIPEREAWTNALKRAMEKDRGRQEEILGTEYGSPQRTGQIGAKDEGASAKPARGVVHEAAQRKLQSKLETLETKLEGTSKPETRKQISAQIEELRTQIRSDNATGAHDRDAIAGHHRLRIEGVKSEIADRESRIARLERTLEGETSKDKASYIRNQIDELNNGHRMFPDDKGQLPIGGNGKPMDSLRDLKDRVAHMEQNMRDAPKAAEINAAVAKQRSHIEDLERQAADGKNVAHELERAHDQLTELTQERIYRSGDPYGGTGSGKREVDPFGDIGTTSSLLSEDDLRIRTNAGDGSFRDDFSKVKNPNVHEHNSAINELKGNITNLSARMRGLEKEDAAAREQFVKENEGASLKDSEKFVGPNAKAIEKIKKDIAGFHTEKDRLATQNGMLTDVGHTAYQETFNKRLGTFLDEWRNLGNAFPKKGATAEQKLGVAAPKLAMMRSLAERATKLATYADVLAPAMRDKLMNFAKGHDGKIASPTDAKAALDALVMGSKEAIRTKDFREAHPPTEKAAKVEGTPDPKAVAAKKAAFLEKAASGDKALIKEMSESTDAKGLQRAVEALNGQEATPEVVKVLDAANARIAELIKADPTVAYGLLTKKYSLESTGKKYWGINRETSDNIDKLAHIGAFGPIKRATLWTTRDGESGYIMRVLDHDVMEKAEVPDPDAATVLTINKFRWDDAPGHGVSIDGPKDGTLAHDKYAHLLRELNPKEERETKGDGQSPDGTYSKFREGNYSTTEMRMLLRSFNEHVKDFHDPSGDIGSHRDTGANPGKENTWSQHRIDRLSAQRMAPNATGPKTSSHKDILDYLHKVLGNTVSLEMANILHAGEFSREQMGDIIRVSVHSLNPMSVAHHEALHGFFQQLRDKGHPEISNVIERMAMSPHIQAQLRERLAHSPEALRQLRDPEEAAAYAYQFWAHDKNFKLQGPQVGVFNRIKQFFRNIMGIWTNDQRAEHILKYFNDGKYVGKSDHILGRDLMDVGKNDTLETIKSIGKPLVNLRDALVSTGSERLHDTGNPALIKLAKLVKAQHTEESSDAGYLPTARAEASTRMDALSKALGTANEAHMQDAFEALQEGRTATTAEGRAAQTAVKGFLKDMRDYVTRAGVKLNDLGADYFPRVYDAYYISSHQDEFNAVLSKYGVGEDTMHRIIAGDGSMDGVLTDIPGMQARKERKLSFIPDSELAPFMKKDFHGVMSNYVAQATKRAEWARRFNDDSSGLYKLLDKAKGQGATKEHIALAQDYVDGINGHLGADISPDARRLMSNMMVYQNVRLLPMMLFSSMVDPLGIMVRGGKLGDAWGAYKRGAKELFSAWKDHPTFDHQTEMATTMGIIDNANLSHTMGATFGGGLSGGTAEKINNAFFKYNFAEQVNQSMRVSAMEAAKRFIVRHVDHPTAHSERYLRELGLTAKDVLKDSQGELLMDPKNLKTKMALNRWVDGAVLRPDAADKPVWMNDPHYALIGHLKQFAFAFQETILKRITHEAAHGNYTPMLAVASYIPVMFAADAAKSLVTSGSLEPDWKNGWSLADHIGYETQRAGLLGVGQFSVDAMNDMKEGGTGIGRLLGPTIEQLAEVAQLAGGRKQFGSVALHAMPANALYANWVNSGDRVREAQAD